MRYTLLRRLFPLLALCLLVQPLFAQTGPPPYSAFTPEAYDAAEENYAAVQDNRGLLYVANQKGVLEFDGLDWRLIPLPGKAPATALAVSDSGRVYVGSINEFGYLEPDILGVLRYTSLHKKLSGAQEIGQVENILVCNDGVYFAAENGIYRWDGRQMSVVQLQEQTTYGLKQLELLSDGTLVSLQGDKALPIRRPAELEEAEFTALTRYTEKLYLLTTKSEIFLYDGGRFRKVNTKADDFFENNIIAEVTPTSGGRYAVGTLRGGVVFMSPDGRIQTVLNQNAGLPNETVQGLYMDNQGGLWMLLEKGIARAEVNSPVSQFDENDGLKGDVNDMLRVGRTLYVATQRGLYFLDTEAPRAVFRPVYGIVSNTWGVTFHRGNIYAGAGAGLYLVEKQDTAKRIYDEELAGMLRSRIFPNRFYAPKLKGLQVLEVTSPEDTVGYQKVENFQREVREIQEDRYGRLWIRGKRWTYIMAFEAEVDSTVEYFNVTYGKELPAPYKLFKYKGEVVFGTRRGLYTYNLQTGEMRKDSSLGERWLNKPIDYFYQRRNGQVLLNSGGRLWLGTKNQETGQWSWDKRSFLRFPGISVTYITEEFGNSPAVWIGHTDGLLRWDPTIKPDYSYDFLTLLRLVNIGRGDSLLFGGAFRGWKGSYVGTRQDTVNLKMSRLQSDFGRIRFRFAAPTFDDAGRTRFNYKLEGWDSTWSGWTTTNRVDYNNLPTGTYTFKVKAKNAYGKVGQQTEYRFVIEPLWYQRWWAIALFVLGGVLILGAVIWAIVKANSYRLRKKNENLQRLVDERTAEVREKNAALEQSNEEIRAAKEEIEKDKAIIEEQNEEITDSINYAFRIQKAILPAAEEIKNGLPQSFVLFKPKDIVSGDFYWYAEVEGKIIITAADCTGHGVPGGFMTMIGNTLLNEIVKRDKVVMPDEILTKLHQGVRKSLSQQSTDNRDGMDMALLTIDKAAGKVHFAGAGNPLIIVKDGEATKIRSDKMAVGGRQDEAERVFQLQSVDIDPRAVYYIYSDGYQDQFGGPKGRKYMTKAMRRKLVEISEQPLEQQGKLLDEDITSWMGDSYEQVDDILVIGVKLGES